MHIISSNFLLIKINLIEPVIIKQNKDGGIITLFIKSHQNIYNLFGTTTHLNFHGTHVLLFLE